MCESYSNYTLSHAENVVYTPTDAHHTGFEWRRRVGLDYALHSYARRTYNIQALGKVQNIHANFVSSQQVLFFGARAEQSVSEGKEIRVQHLYI